MTWKKKKDFHVLSVDFIIVAGKPLLWFRRCYRFWWRTGPGINGDGIWTTAACCLKRHYSYHTKVNSFVKVDILFLFKPCLFKEMPFHLLILLLFSYSVSLIKKLCTGLQLLIMVQRYHIRVCIASHVDSVALFFGWFFQACFLWFMIRGESNVWNSRKFEI